MQRHQGFTLVEIAIDLDDDFPSCRQKRAETGQLQNLTGHLGVDGSSYQISVMSDVSVQAIPEPETYAMLLAGLGLLGFVARRRKQRTA